MKRPIRKPVILLPRIFVIPKNYWFLNLGTEKANFISSKNSFLEILKIKSLCNQSLAISGKIVATF